MLRIRQLKLPVEHSRRDLEQKIIKTLRIRPEELIRYLVWDTFRVSKVAKTHWAMIYAVAVAVIVYLACTLLELLRQQLVKWFAPIWEKTLLYRKEQNLYLKITKRVNDPS